MFTVVYSFSESKLHIKGAGAILRLPLKFYRTSLIKNKHFILEGNLVSFFLIIGFILEIRTKHWLSKIYFKAFPSSHLQLVLRRISLYYKKFFLWFLTAIPPLAFFFLGNITAIERMEFYVISVLQNLFTIYLFISVYDFLEFKGFDRHITNLPAILAVIMIYFRTNNIENLLLFNPFGGVFYLPLVFHSSILFLILVVLLMILYGTNKYYIHQLWNNN